MRYFLLFLFIAISSIGFSQSKEININWDGYRVFSTSSAQFEIPYFNNHNFNFTPSKGISLSAQWSENIEIDQNSIVIENVTLSDITVENLKQLDRNIIPKELTYDIKTSISRGKMYLFLDLFPIINQNGNFKKVNSFRFSYKSGISNKLKRQRTQNSVLNSGEWYKFYVDKSGIFRLSRSFLSQLGLNTNSIDPRNIKIFGNGGNMLPLSNSVEYPVDPIENAIKVHGEDDGVFNNSDYILFYAEGPNAYNSDSNTNLNLYSDQTAYFINISPSPGKRILENVQPVNTANTIVDSYTAYKYHELDEYNIAKIGRRWFGDRFDFESNQTFEFTFPNLRTSEPINLRVYTAAVSEISTSMSVEINNQEVSNLNYTSINDPILVSGDYFTGEIMVSNSNISVDLNYNNNGNPSSVAYLDYISLEGTCDLNYNGDQFIFYNKNVVDLSGIAQYNITNANSISNIWEITDLNNVSEIFIDGSESTASFKALLGEEKRYIAFNQESFYEPIIEGETNLENQNLKSNIFLDDQNQFQDLDYLIICRSDMLYEAERLAQINRDFNNLNVKVVTLEKIYNEFSSGNQDIAAIRNFVKYIYFNASDESRRIKYLCLFGDASFDYKDRISQNTNIVPSWYSLNSYSLASSYVSDDFFGMMDNSEGMMENSDKLDIAVGRILADSPQRATDLVDKISSYYNANSYGDWRNKLIVISDDVDEPWESIIQGTSNSLADLITDNKPFFNVKKILSDAYVQESSSGGERYPEVNNAIIDGIELGALVVNYFGHGGEDGIARERIFDKIDATELSNENKLNCFVSVTCEFTKFDNPGRNTAGEFLYWNKNGGAIALITTTRQIFVSVGVNFNLTLENYLFSLNSDNYHTMAEALRLTKNDPSISGSDQRRLVFFIGDPAMKLAIPKPNIRITEINDILINEFTEPLQGLSSVKIEGQIDDEFGNKIDDYQGELVTTVFDKNIDRSTLGNDGTSQNDSPIILDFTTLGEVLFRGRSSIENGDFNVNFIVPRDVVMEVGNGKMSFYSKSNSNLMDQNGSNLDVLIGGINEDADEDNMGPEIELFMNDEAFISGGITNENPHLLVKLFDENGINTSSGIGHDIVAVLDDDVANSFRLNDYYEANLDDYQNGTINYPLRDISPGLHTLSLKAWDVYNNSSTSEIQFVVHDQDLELVISNVLNYPNPFINYTEFWFNHNSSSDLSVSIQIFTISGKLVKTINGYVNTSNSSSLSRDLSWNARDDFGDKVAKGVYIYRLTVRSDQIGKQVSKTEKLVIL
ncbi:MAG: type IX secretion system sortase PorU [Flavobacteriaceae bacterium]|nr:type IX secretion system sortase PorU [Flavobacteriaceae bacterium]